MKIEVVNKEVALNDLEGFINHWLEDEAPAKDKLEELYKPILNAIVDGFLTFDDEQDPKLKLKKPIDWGGDLVGEISFAKRIKPLTLASIAKGIDLKTDPMTLQFRMVANLTNKPVAFVDSYCKYDLNVVQAIAGIFSEL